MKKYLIEFEVEADTALFVRPDTGPTPTSYPAPPYSQAKGLIESVLLQRSVLVNPIRVEICAPLQFHRYSTNYGGPLRKADQVAGANNYQLLATVLTDVKYVIHAELLHSSHGPRGINHPHAFQDRFYRRLETGRWWRTPCLGWSEFTPKYLGLRRPGTAPVDLNLEIPAMLHSPWDALQDGRLAPSFRQNVRIEKGILHYA